MCIYTLMDNDNTGISPAHKAVAQAVLDVLDTRYFKALCEPTRVEIIRKLITIGACDVGTIAHGLAQDRSVISRHLATLERAGICVSRKIGRRVLYDLDGPYIVAKVTSILDAIRPMAELCKPFENLSERKGVA
ncbi:MAG TPA: transcriptional regulator [Hellea balneolensis]|uniref:Transcriptional regulator n=1 Tax=Hellea balneolensis TaxID=287478 RepID=A0A7V5NXL0_9PROT|nr:transcriptional regulator [Hellea balneolensis]